MRDSHITSEFLPNAALSMLKCYPNVALEASISKLRSRAARLLLNFCKKKKSKVIPLLIIITFLLFGL
jgi:hypothetical protein